VFAWEALRLGRAVVKRSRSIYSELLNLNRDDWRNGIAKRWRQCSDWHGSIEMKKMQERKLVASCELGFCLDA
jgi:hypothetical protein